jgi:hypothetical protein
LGSEGAVRPPEMRGLGGKGSGGEASDGSHLTTPHKLQGRGAFGKPRPGTVWLCWGCRKATAAP